MPAFVLDVKELDSLGRDYTFEIDPVWLGEQLEGTSLRASNEPGKIEARAQKTQDDVLVRAHVVASLVAECDRCLEDVTIPFDLHITSLVSPEGSLVEDDDFAEDSLDRETYRGDEVVLDRIVVEHLILEVPMQIHCPEGCEMPHIPPSVRGPDDFGAKPAVDPRLAPLLKLKKEGPEGDQE